ncbi:MAG: aminopeptidase P family protein [Thermomicrobiales bacterium]
MSRRLDRVRELLEEHTLDGMLITSPSNRYYLSGFLSNDDGGQLTAALLVDRDVATLMTGATNLDWARSAAQNVSVAEWSRPWTPVVAEFMREAGWKRVGFEDATLTVAAFQALSTELGRGHVFFPLGNRIDQLRRMKDPAERTRMARVIALTDGAFAESIADLSAGMTERAFAWRIDRALRDQGADGSAFPTIVASGPNSSRPHHAPSDRVMQEGEAIIVDMGARLDGYNGDLTRTVWIGDPDARLKEIVDVVYEAHAAAWLKVATGVNAAEVHQVAEAVASGAGYGEQYLHGTGHGLGLLVHEAPSCGPSSADVLHEGDVLTIEPGIYLPGWGGVRIEDVGVLDKTGFSRLTGAEQRRP